MATLIDVRDYADVQTRRPVLIAHRGGVVTSTVPACSREAIRLAGAFGYQMVELDVRQSKDLVPVVFHDPTLQGACGVEKSVADLTREELSALRYVLNDEPILTLDEALAECRALELGVMLDIKAGESKAFFGQILDALEKHKLLRATVCINGAAPVRKYLAGSVMLRITEEELAALERGESVPLKERFWFGGIDVELVAFLRAKEVLIIPAANAFRYPKESHREDAKRDIDRLMAAGVDGFQIDSVYQDYFGLEPAE